MAKGKEERGKVKGEDRQIGIQKDKKEKKIVSCQAKIIRWKTKKKVVTHLLPTKDIKNSIYQYLTSD